jgi:hypothetical protein
MYIPVTSYREPMIDGGKRSYREVMKVSILNHRDCTKRVVNNRILKSANEPKRRDDGLNLMRSSSSSPRARKSFHGQTHVETSLPGCEFDGVAMGEMMQAFPDEQKLDVHRFLIARKGDVRAAIEMMKNSLKWRKENLPATLATIGDALSLNCLFVGKPALDGTATLYFRSALFDSRKIPSEQFVLCAAHGIDFALKKGSTAVTVMVDISTVPGAPNLNADLKFIQTFAKIMGDVFPERLRKLLVYPFPWYGKAIWSLISVFLDQRTRDKVILVSAKGDEHMPAEVANYVSLYDIPAAVGGKDRKNPIPNMTNTLATTPTASL